MFSTPFLVDAAEVEERLQLQLIELQCDNSLENHHQPLSLPDFYQSLEKDKFALMRRHAKRMVSLFGSTYICEQTFSVLTPNKNRLRTKMTDSHLCDVFYISTTKLTPDLPAVLQVSESSVDSATRFCEVITILDGSRVRSRLEGCNLINQNMR